MSNWEHARLNKKVINFDHAGDKKIYCAWDECDRDGYELHRVKVNYGTAGTPHNVTYVFCTDRHKQYWLHSEKKYGNLPPGYRLSCV